MGLELKIPFRHHTAIRSMIPELTDEFCPDKDTRRKYWNAFMRDELARPYKVQ